VDRELRLEVPLLWREYEIGVHDLPGHTLYAAAYSFTADGRRVVATGDQQDTAWEPGLRPELLNYQYRNRFRSDDFVRSAELYRRIGPDLMISGHWQPFEVSDAYLDMLLEQGQRLARLHREILPRDVDFGAEGFGARVSPYRSVVAPGGRLRLEAEVVNPFAGAGTADVEIVLPAGWRAKEDRIALDLAGHGTGTARFEVRIPEDAAPVERARVAVDLTVGTMRFGQQAEALVSVR
jgi:hypothetical protein